MLNWRHIITYAASSIFSKRMNYIPNTLVLPQIHTWQCLPTSECISSPEMQHQRNWTPIDQTTERRGDITVSVRWSMLTLANLRRSSQQNLRIVVILPLLKILFLLVPTKAPPIYSKFTFFFDLYMMWGRATWDPNFQNIANATRICLSL